MKNWNIFSILCLISLLIFTGSAYSENSVTAVSDLYLSQISQVFPPVADGGRDIVTYVSAKTLFRGYGSSRDNNVVKYEWDFDGDGQYDWESAESGLSYHTYKVPGNYIAFFRVTDSHGNSSIDIIKVLVREGRGEQDFLEKTILKSSKAVQSASTSDGISNRYAVIINGSSTSRFWDDVTFMYSTLINDYQFTPQSIYLFNYNGTDPSGANPNNMIDYPARTTYIDDVFTELGNIMDSDDDLFIWITGHGRGYNGPGSTYYGYLDGHASVDPGDEEDYLESDFKLRSFYMTGYYSSYGHGMDVWKVYKDYYSSGNYRMWRHKYVSHFTKTYFEDIDKSKRDNDVFIERFVDYLAGDYDRDGIIETDVGEVYDYDGDGVPPHDPSTDTFDEDDWGFIDSYEDDVTNINTQVPGDSYIIFDDGLDNRLDIDIDYDINNLEVDGTDIDNQGLFDGIDVNDDGDMDDWVSIDELIQLYIDELSDDELAVFLDRINARVISIIAEPCFSGGLIEDLSSPNRVISTATTEENLSYGNIFIRNFTSAFHWANFWGTPVDADYDGNGLISMQEAFNYASLYDYYNETPQYDDNGDGISNPYPIPNGGDGNLGANEYLVMSDMDGDGILNDGDGSGIIGDNPCTGGNTIGCDDNCIDIYNPDQSDVDGDGIGDECDINALPTANPGGPYLNIEGQAIILDGSNSSDSDGTIALYEWDIDNDGTFDYSSTSPTQSHPYIQQGAYTIKLRVTDNLGATDEAVTTANISDSSPTADLTGLPTNGIAPLTVNFTDYSIGYDQPLSYEWDFDNDGTVDSTAQNPQPYSYNNPGIYTVKLTVVDSDASTDSLTRTDYITVTQLVYTLTININGIGSGIVTSSPLGIDCGTDCTETYDEVTTVTLTALPNAGSTFTGWTGGGCSGTDDCIVTMNIDTDVTATFDTTCSNPPVKIGGTYYSTLQSAYNAAGDGNIIQSQAVRFTENLNINRNISVTLEGGYDCDYTTNTGITTINGNMTVSDGIFTIQSGTFEVE